MYPITFFKKLEDLEICGSKLSELDHPDFEFPWELIDWVRQTISKILNLKSKNHNLNLKSDNVYVGKDVLLLDYVVFNTSNGQIMIDDNVTIEPFVYIEGPCYIGQNCTIKAHSQIRHNTSIGHDCRIGGEVSGSIFQPYTNKAHHGFIGDSYIGSWVNLGAGTSSSNLKNTYGPVRVDYRGQKIDTKMQFLGCMLGDYVKTAINTSIYTGKIIGVGAQLMGIVMKNVESFVMMTPEGEKEFELEAAIRSQKRMFERRGVEQSVEDVEMLKRVFEETRNERNFQFL